MAMTPEERRAKDADRKRKARAKAAASRESKKAESRTDEPSELPSTMRTAVGEALAHMKWLVPSDIASRVQALELARQVDLHTHNGDDTKALSAHRALSRVLADLGGTPIVRMQRELRSRKLSPNPEEDNAGDERPTGNVSKFERPKKRPA